MVALMVNLTMFSGGFLRKEGKYLLEEQFSCGKLKIP